MPEIVITERTAGKTTTDTAVNIELPEIAWRGSFANYRDLVAHTTEAADEFHYATFLQVFGCTLGRRLNVYHAGTQYPNFYTCLVGRSGLTRKDTSHKSGRKVINMLHAHVDYEQNPPFKIISGIRSVEGLLDELAGENRVRLIIQGELLALLSKARQDKLGHIIPTLTELYDCPDILNPPVHQKNVKPAIKPFLSIMAGTTEDWLHKALYEHDIYGGFANRWLYFYGPLKRPLSDPPKVDKQKLDNLVHELNFIREWAEDVPDGEVTISDEARELFASYYAEYYRRCNQPGLIPTLIVRIQDFIFKIALLYAADQQQSIISAEHLKAAIEVGNYLEDSSRQLFANFGVSKSKKSENKVLEYLKNAGQPIEYRDCYRNLNMSAKELELCVEPLIKLGTINNHWLPGKKSSRKVRFLEAV